MTESPRGALFGLSTVGAPYPTVSAYVARWTPTGTIGAPTLAGLPAALQAHEKRVRKRARNLRLAARGGIERHEQTD